MSKRAKVATMREPVKIVIPVSHLFLSQVVLFEQAFHVMKQAFGSERGLSRQDVCRLFGAMCPGRSCWRDSSFLIWSGVHNCASAEAWINFIENGTPLVAVAREFADA
jgi:hypothetical protein